MQLITEYMPDLSNTTVVYEDRLLDLEIRPDIEREKVDILWSNIFYACIGYTERAQLAAHTADNILDLMLIPSDYSLRNKTVNVMLRSYVLAENFDQPCVGPVAHASVDLQGRITTERGRVLSYHKEYSSYMRDLLAETALNYAELDTHHLRMI